MYYDKMFLKDTKNAPQLKSAMTDDEYLDAFSAPRIDPTRMGKKVLMTKPRPESSETSDDDDNSSSLDDDDGESNWEDEDAEEQTLESEDKEGDTDMAHVG